eukprot:1308120-Pyramimonas_sp.AAC.1
MTSAGWRRRRAMTHAVCCHRGSDERDGDGGGRPRRPMPRCFRTGFPEVTGGSKRRKNSRLVFFKTVR